MLTAEQVRGLRVGQVVHMDVGGSCLSYRVTAVNVKAPSATVQAPWNPALVLEVHPVDPGRYVHTQRVALAAHLPAFHRQPLALEVHRARARRRR